MKDRQAIVLSVQARGNLEFPRYVIHDQFARYRACQGWTLDETEALVFEDQSAAAREIHRLLMLEYTGRPVRRYRAPVFLDLYSDRAVTLDEIRHWLVKVAKLLIDSPKHGNGPLEGTLGLTNFEWAELELVEN